MVPMKPWRQRDVEWGELALALALLCAVFTVWPQLDLRVSRHFVSDGVWWGNAQVLVLAVYEAVPWVGRALALACLFLVLFGLWRPQQLPRHWRRRAAGLGLLMLLGVGGVVNGALKEGWGRARPVTMQAFGGVQPFTPALRPTFGCQTNCSFVSGHAATGFAVLGLGLFGGAAMRRRWWAYGMLAGLVVGFGRIAQGGHFLSDVLFAGWAMWATALVLRQLWLLHRVRQLRARSARSGHPKIRHA